MWRSLSKQPSLRKLKPSITTFGAVKPSGDSIFSEGIAHSLPRSSVNTGDSELGFLRGAIFRRKHEVGHPSYAFRSDPFGVSGNSRGYAAAAEAVVSSSEEEASVSTCEEEEELVEKFSKENASIILDTKNHQSQKRRQRQRQNPKTIAGMSYWKYNVLRRRQIKVETEAWKEATREYQELLTDMCEQKLAPNLSYFQTLFLGWFEPLRDAIAAEQKLSRDGNRRSSTHAPYFDLLPAEMMAVITMHKLMASLMSVSGGCRNGVALRQAAGDVGEAIEHEARIHKFLEICKRKNALNRACDEERDPAAAEQQRSTKKVKLLLKKQRVQQVRGIVSRQDGLKSWGREAQLKVGSRLIQILMDTAYIQPPLDQMEDVDVPPDIRPAFVHAVKFAEIGKNRKRCGVIECDPIVRKGLEKTAKHMVIPYMPMLVPPLNWTGYERGAYLFLPSYIMRTHGAGRQQKQAFKKAPKEQLEPILQALNTLGNTKWRVNKKILSVINRIWANGGQLADLVDREDIPLPEKPDTEDEEELKKWRWNLRAAKKENSERNSERCNIELKLVVARIMKDEEGFYYPHNLDFRGRAYPMHPYLNHLGNDVSRGILEFAEGRPLGKSGLRWLKIQLANVFGGGVDKLSFNGRVSFAENNLEDIFDSADRPLEGRRWWLGAENPFQCLATCVSLAEALRSPSPETFISHMPVHQDGSCNGLQHYAALGRDKLGAAAVNLTAGDKPADVYSGIAARVLEIMKADAEEDPAIDPNARHARLLIDQVDRKLVKQTVMTSVYGVTYIGARDQIKKRLKERHAIDDDSEMFACACYAARTTLIAIREMFEAARNIMEWLGECAKIIAKANEPVRWTTPLGLPVVQPYRILGGQQIKTSLQVLTILRETDKVMSRRQRTAFPPNFVHSLDSSHMMMTAVACSKAGLNFAGVHDSYWTHACDVDQMNQILREKFVELYEQPILENLLESFRESFPKGKFPPLPERGDFDLKEVLGSKYFFN